MLLLLLQYGGETGMRARVLNSSPKTNYCVLSPITGINEGSSKSPEILIFVPRKRVSCNITIYLVKA